MNMKMVAGAADEINLLDLLVTLAESWKLFAIIPIATACVAFGIALLLPREYASSATIGMSQERSEILRSPEVIDPVLEASGLVDVSGNGIEAARAAFLSKLSDTQRNGVTGEVELTLRQATPTAAQSLLARLVDQIGSVQLGVVATNDTGLTELRRMLAAYRGQNRTLGNALTHLEAQLEATTATSDTSPRLGPDGYATALVEISDRIRSNAIRIAALETELDSRLAADANLHGSAGFKVIEPANLQPTPLGRSPTSIAAFTFVLVAIGVLVFIFARDSFRKALANPEAARKMDRVREAFWRTKSS